VKSKLTTLAEEIDLHLRTIRQILRKPAEAEFARGGLTGPQRAVMHCLVNSDGLSLKELSRQVGLAHSTVSGIVDRLQKQGLVERKADHADARISRIKASKVVRNYVRDVLPSLTVTPLTTALRRATPRERKAILEGLRTLRRLLPAE